MSETPQSPAAVAPLSSSPAQTSRRGPWIIAALVILLLILHQDNWFWTDGTLVFGFLPIGLFWHACISIGASLTWFLSTKIAWPIDPELESVLVPDTDAPASTAPHDQTAGQGEEK
ncbi:DUF3311 domain-containing protein [Allorhodopirellula solitaria]|uniref:DUF3311 domain-containing protein n=1 Tax=Allorhodopirellula solitaria TaxID=2527987 RepID=A0A5C5YK43_9BACT|nr:DUF3311 domain-containing protein [Allorhodopirellula solitaria]TWT75188.1 hypothetical protein CA85_04770 [Allorhodopirellula solitaria]